MIKKLLVLWDLNHRPPDFQLEAQTTAPSRQANEIVFKVNFVFIDFFALIWIIGHNIIIIISLVNFVDSLQLETRKLLSLYGSSSFERLNYHDQFVLLGWKGLGSAYEKVIGSILLSSM